MSSQVQRRLVKYGCCAGFVGLMAWVYISLRDFSGASRVQKLMMLCDAFTVPGVLLLSVGLLVMLANAGAVDGLLYALSVAGKALIPGGRKRIERYSDFVDRRHEKPAKGYGFLLISGGVTMGIALIFLIAYHVYA